MKYRVDVDVESASGFQTWEVEADSPEQALVKLKKGDGDIVENQIEVTSSGIDAVTSDEFYTE